MKGEKGKNEEEEEEEEDGGKTFRVLSILYVRRVFLLSACAVHTQGKIENFFANASKCDRQTECVIYL